MVLTTKIIMVQTELYRMKRYLTTIIAGIILLWCITQVYAESGISGNAELSFTSATEEGGFISTELALPSHLQQEDTSGILSYWLYPSGNDCKTARLLGWQQTSESAGKIAMKAAVPYAVIPGTYTLGAQFKPGNSLPLACDTGTSAQTTVGIVTPGQAGRDMSAALSGGTEARNGASYQIDSISGVDTAIRKAPGETVTPTLKITNTGSDDTSGLPVEVHAYLGTEELIPADGMIASLQAGNSQTVGLTYTIPDTIPLRSYPFFVIVDPRGSHGPVDPDKNLKRTGGQMTVRVVEPDTGAGCEYCRRFV
jgi:hypothetical protein